MPRTLVWDGEGAIGRWRSGRTELTAGVPGVSRGAGHQGGGLKPRRPGSTRASSNGPTTISSGRFCPAGRLPVPADFNPQFGNVAGRSSTLGGAGCWGAHRPIGSARTGRRCWRCRRWPRQVGWRNSTRLARDHYVRLDSNDYSVHPGVIGRRIEVTADLDRVQVFCDGKTVADHERVWAWHQTITDPEHRAGGQHAAPQPNRCPATGA